MRLHDVLAPGKVNLTLHVLGRRPDGYHELASLFVPIALSDRLRVEVGGRVSRVRVPGMPELESEENLCLRAARAFAARTGLPAQVKVHLEKRLPVAAGLGGGSADAGAVLRVLCRHHGLSPDDPRVRAAALDTGSDVPFFLAARPALARGRGEILGPAPALPDALHLVIVKPPFGVPAAEAYRALARARERGELPAGRERPLPARLTSVAAVARLLHNDLQAAVETLHPIDDLARRLRAAGARATLMSGSGSCVLGLCASGEDARKCARRLDLRAGETTFVTRTLKRAPGVRDAPPTDVQRGG